MANAQNSVTLIGRITADPEIKKTQNNKSVVTFTLAISRTHKDESGNYPADFISCVSWNQSADYLGTYARKGNQIAVHGELRSRSYDRSDGTKVYVTEVLTDAVKIIYDGKKDVTAATNSYQDPLGAAPSTSSAQQYTSSFEYDGISSEDLPF